MKNDTNLSLNLGFDPAPDPSNNSDDQKGAGGCSEDRAAGSASTQVASTAASEEIDIGVEDLIEGLLVRDDS